jgi:hypothetical protein
MWTKEKKTLDSRHDTTTATRSQMAPREPDVVYPMGDFRNQKTNRKFESLLGVQPRQERRELEAFADERQDTDLEAWEKRRALAQERAEKDAEVAMKKDESAWVDEDGYSQIREAPAFRDGLNTTLRVKPPPEDHLHNGLKLAKDRQDNVNLPQGAAPRTGIVRATARRADIAQGMGLVFIRGLAGLDGAKSRNLVKDGERVEGEVELLLRALETVELPQGHVGEVVDAEGGKRQEVIANALGNAFMDIGMTAPAGVREDPLRNDVVAIDIGQRMMLGAEGGRTLPMLTEPALRHEVALAVGRAMLHLRAAAGIEASRSTAPIVEGNQNDRTRIALGRLTLQLLEAGATRAGKVVTKDPVRREVLARALGGIVQMDTNEVRDKTTERTRQELAQLARDAALGGTFVAPGQLPHVVRQNKPTEVMNRRPLLPTGETQLQPRAKPAR